MRVIKVTPVFSVKDQKRVYAVEVTYSDGEVRVYYFYGNCAEANRFEHEVRMQIEECSST